MPWVEPPQDPMFNKPRIIRSVQGCARCGEDHTDLTFWQLEQTMVDGDGTTWTHWATCPVTFDPIMLRFYEPKESGNA
jgi:hypothetical protein